jgi:leader peptidase (prepilin peptidase) / N-methyltransferase
VTTALVAILAGVLGAAFGSFFNVVAYRLPRKESLNSPPSHCPKCKTPIKPYDNIPIFGWLLLRGRCRSCGEPISLRYPIVEALTAALAVSVVLARHSTQDRVLGLALIAALVPISLIDLDERIIPNKITAPAAIVAVVLGLIVKPSGVPEQLIAGVAAAGFLLLFAVIYPAGLGMGDVKLAGVLGLFLGREVAVALFAGIVAGAVLGVMIIARLGIKKGRKTGIPFGPFLAFGGVVGILAGHPIVHWYLHSVIHS